MFEGSVKSERWATRMGRKSKWFRKARGYFDNKPGKLAACPPEIRSTTNAAQAFDKPCGFDPGSLAEPRAAAPSVEPTRDYSWAYA